MMVFNEHPRERVEGAVRKCRRNPTVLIRWGLRDFWSVCCIVADCVLACMCVIVC